MRYRATNVLTILVVIHAAIALGQTARPAPPADALARANAAFAQGDWQRTLDEYSAVAKAFPAHALSRFRIGVALVGLGKFSEGEASLREGERLGVAVGPAGFRLAESLAEQGKLDAAIGELSRSAAAGFFLTPAQLNGNAHFARLRSTPKWPAVLDAFDAVVQPCLHDPRFREFDFWIGDWDVRTTGSPAVGPAARNTVTLEENGCVVTEHWVAPGGSQGQSYNIFDRSIGQWRQTWVDNVGGQHDYRGGIKDGNMHYLGDVPAPNGQLGRTPLRLTFFKIGSDTVRQFGETSADSGKTWTPSYDLTYVRRKGAQGLRPTSVPLSDADRAAILALDSAQVAAWLKDDTTRVLSAFAPDAVLIPPGSAPVLGLAAIRGHWWPADGSYTRITSFKRSIAEVGGGGGVAFVRGSAVIQWTSAKKGEAPKAQTSRSNDLILYARDAAGNWRITRQIWSTLP